MRIEYECPNCYCIYSGWPQEGKYTCEDCGGEFFIEHDAECGLLVSPINDTSDEITMAKEAGLC